MSAAPTLAPEQAAADPAVEFLLTAAAADFHTYRPSDPVRVRDVRVGHVHDVMAPGGGGQAMLCGQFLAAQEGGRAEWTDFATIKTSGYEQLNGAQAAGFCRGPSVVWAEEGDLSSTLQRRLDALR